MTAGEKLRQLREARNWTMDDLAALAGYKNKASIFKLEKGGSEMTQTMIKKFASIFRVNPLDFVFPDEEHERPQCMQVPVFDRIPAGMSIPAYHTISAFERMDRRPGEFFAVRAKGTAMMPRIMDGDTVILKQSSECESGQICAVGIGANDAILTKVIKSETGMMLIPMNNEHQARFFTNQEIGAHHVRILGVAIETRAKL